MPYVMMPVPEEHVEEVMQFILRAIAKASIQPWDSESVSKLYGEVDEATRSLLAFVARAAVGGGEIAAADAAAKSQLTAREVTGIVNELQALTREASQPNLITPLTVPERLPNGRVLDKRILQMDPEVAELVRAAEQEELSGELGAPGGVNP